MFEPASFLAYPEKKPKPKGFLRSLFQDPFRWYVLVLFIIFRSIVKSFSYFGASIFVFFVIHENVNAPPELV